MEEDEFRLEWRSGKFEKEERRGGETCGDKSAWGEVHRCCEEHCIGILSELKAFPFAAWDDVSAAPLDPAKVVSAMKLGIEYAEKEPAWNRYRVGRRRSGGGR